MEFPEDCAFSVIFGDHFETLDLVASSADEANIWVTGLSYLIGGKKNKCKETVLGWYFMLHPKLTWK